MGAATAIISPLRGVSVNTRRQTLAMVALDLVVLSAVAWLWHPPIVALRI